MTKTNHRYGFLGMRLQCRRLDLGLTIEGLASLINFDVSLICNIENGSVNVSYNDFVTISMALGCTSDQVLDLQISPLDKLKRVTPLRRVK